MAQVKRKTAGQKNENTRRRAAFLPFIEQSCVVFLHDTQKKKKKNAKFKTRKKGELKRSGSGERKTAQLLALSLHIAAGECAPKNYLGCWSGRKAAAPSVEEEFRALKTDTSFSSMQISYS
ncbi:hypothetical protein AMECASPLE_002823 [Ameca splendens]|uniref:Uncharacterized protein n=1 Tax=Ameca splendens TaxID=208324 RepID=A0ABV0ZI59_9TELE